MELANRCADRAARGSPFALARTTTNTNDGGPVQTVQARLDALSVRDKIPLLYGFGMTASPPIGADLHVAFLDGDPSKAVAIASGHQTYRLRGLGAGDSALLRTAAVRSRLADRRRRDHDRPAASRTPATPRSTGNLSRHRQSAVIAEIIGRL